MTTYNIDHRDPMSLTDIKSDLLTEPPPNAMLASRSVCNALKDNTEECHADHSLWGMDVFVIDEVDWVPGLAKDKMLLGSRQDVMGIIKWVQWLRTLPEYTREVFTAMAQDRYDKAREESQCK